MDAGGYCRGKQHRSPLTAIHGEGNINGQADHMEHKTHAEDTNNNRTVSQGADHESTGHLEDIFRYTLN